MYVCINFNIVLLAIGTHKGEQLNVQRWPLPSTYVSDFNLGSAWMNDGAWLCSLIFFKGAWLFYDTNKLYKTKLIYTLLSKSISLLPNTKFKWFVQSARNWQLGFRSFFCLLWKQSMPFNKPGLRVHFMKPLSVQHLLAAASLVRFRNLIQAANQWVCHHFSERVVFSTTCWFSQVLTVVAESW